MEISDLLKVLEDLKLLWLGNFDKTNGINAAITGGAVANEKGTLNGNSAAFTAALNASNDRVTNLSEEQHTVPLVGDA